jgi:hypothetical protein
MSRLQGSEREASRSQFDIDAVVFWHFHNLMTRSGVWARSTHR